MNGDHSEHCFSTSVQRQHWARKGGTCDIRYYATRYKGGSGITSSYCVVHITPSRTVTQLITKPHATDHTQYGPRLPFPAARGHLGDCHKQHSTLPYVHVHIRPNDSWHYSNGIEDGRRRRGREPRRPRAGRHAAGATCSIANNVYNNTISWHQQRTATQRANFNIYATPHQSRGSWPGNPVVRTPWLKRG